MASAVCRRQFIAAVVCALTFFSLATTAELCSLQFDVDSIVASKGTGAIFELSVSNNTIAFQESRVFGGKAFAFGEQEDGLGVAASTTFANVQDILVSNQGNFLLLAVHDLENPTPHCPHCAENIFAYDWLDSNQRLVQRGTAITIATAPENILAANGDGTVIVVRTNASHAQTFAWDETVENWRSRGPPLTGAEKQPALAANGQRLALSDAYYDWNGRVLVFSWSGDTASWVQDIELRGSAPEERFGSSVALSGDGNLLVVGANGAINAEGERTGRVNVYRRNPATGEWSLQATVTADSGVPDDNFGAFVSLSSDGFLLAVSANNMPAPEPSLYSSGGPVGRAYLFQNVEAGIWTEVGFMDGTSENDGLGYSVALNERGDLMAAGTIAPQDYVKIARIDCGNVTRTATPTASPPWEIENPQSPSTPTPMPSMFTPGIESSSPTITSIYEGYLLVLVIGLSFFL